MPLNSVLSPGLGGFFGSLGSMCPTFSLNSLRSEQPSSFQTAKKSAPHPATA